MSPPIKTPAADSDTSAWKFHNLLFIHLHIWFIAHYIILCIPCSLFFSFHVFYSLLSINVWSWLRMKRTLKTRQGVLSENCNIKLDMSKKTFFIFQSLDTIIKTTKPNEESWCKEGHRTFCIQKGIARLQWTVSLVIGNGKYWAIILITRNCNNKNHFKIRLTNFDTFHKRSVRHIWVRCLYGVNHSLRRLILLSDSALQTDIFLV